MPRLIDGQAYDLHANSYLVKPLDSHCFRQLVEELSLYWGVWNMPITGERAA